ncbi:RNase H domain-containing protein [Trichonephila clavipes]|uniref:RNase H domain-containing protein n=1 Tax=Trichonephila clavipes TaxID=2585209 RepID=A0A8X6W1I9_TRICX|nr:RNase H domain-containing protein [Trichonephila clavipes]
MDHEIDCEGFTYFRGFIYLFLHSITYFFGTWLQQFQFETGILSWGFWNEGLLKELQGGMIQIEFFSDFTIKLESRRSFEPCRVLPFIKNLASNFTSELVAIREALILYQQNPHVIYSTEGLVIFSDSKLAIEAIRNGETNISCDIITLLEQLRNKRKSCILQWIPAHVNIEGNECADSLAKEARDIEHKCTTITPDDANAVAKHRILNHTFKKPLVTEFDCPRIITSTIARLRTEHLKGMKIHPDKTRSYVQCKHCPDLQLTPNLILERPTVATKLLKMGMVPLRDSLRELLYSPDAPRIAEAVIKTFDGI